MAALRRGGYRALALSCSWLTRAGLGLPRAFLAKRRHPSAFPAGIVMIAASSDKSLLVEDLAWKPYSRLRLIHGFFFVNFSIPIPRPVVITRNDWF